MTSAPSLVAAPETSLSKIEHGDMLDIVATLGDRSWKVA